MYKIDLAMKGLSDQIEALSKRGIIAQINAEYSDVGYFTATSESITDYTNGMVISLSLNQTNQGTVGLNINEIGTVQIVYATPEGQLQDITSGMMKQNSVYFCVYNGTYWVLSSAGYASTSNNVSDTINGKNITDIFETDGTTAKNATLQKQTEKLQTPVSIGLSGVTSTPQQFDGSQGINIPITEIPGEIVKDVVKKINQISPQQDGSIQIQAQDVGAASAQESNMKTYTLVSQLGLTIGQVSTKNVYDAMPQNSFLQTYDTAVNDQPMQPCLLLIQKTANNRGMAVQYAIRSGEVGIKYIMPSTQDGTLSNTWEKCMNEIIQYTSVQQLGLDVGNVQTQDVFSAMPDGSMAMLYDSDISDAPGQHAIIIIYKVLNVRGRAFAYQSRQNSSYTMLINQSQVGLTGQWVQI